MQITWADKADGVIGATGTVSAADMNQIKAAVNSKQDAGGSSGGGVSEPYQIQSGDMPDDSTLVLDALTDKKADILYFQGGFYMRGPDYTKDQADNFITLIAPNTLSVGQYISFTS